MKMLILLTVTLFSLVGSVGSATPATPRGLTIHAIEFGIGRFQRRTSHYHPYAPTNVWRPYVLPENEQVPRTFSRRNDDGSYSIFFLNLDELLKATIQLTSATHQKILVFNIIAHGVPGLMGYPANAEMQNSDVCEIHRSITAASDDIAYEQYYSPVTAPTIEAMHGYGLHFTDRDYVQNRFCGSTATDWQTELALNPAFVRAISHEAQIHFFACYLGYGPLGESFTLRLSQLLFPQGGSTNARVETSLQIELGDWSMPDGMGFWEFTTEADLERDMNLYENNLRDSELAQLGKLRRSFYDGHQWTVRTYGGLRLQRLNYQTALDGQLVPN